jgi:hypothetical protein
MKATTYGDKKCPLSRGKLFICGEGGISFARFAVLADPQDGGGQIKEMSVRYAHSHFCFCAFVGASSTTLQSKNAPAKPGTFI